MLIRTSRIHKLNTKHIHGESDIYDELKILRFFI